MRRRLSTKEVSGHAFALKGFFSAAITTIAKRDFRVRKLLFSACPNERKHFGLYSTAENIVSIVLIDE
jgi:hypothetical protein